MSGGGAGVGGGGRGLSAPEEAALRTETRGRLSADLT